MIGNKRAVHEGRALQAILPVVLSVLIGLAADASTARAQGSRKDDVVFNAQGRPMAGATVRICTSAATGQPCTPLAQIYSDPGLTQALANPTTADGMGNYTFYAAPGRYLVEISGPGITTKQLSNVILPSDPTSPTFTTVTTTSGISAFSMSLTGNLTVNGSTAVVGSLTVGGAAVPSVNQDNVWTNNQRHRGPVPYVDFTAFMPAGGCSSTSSFTTPTATMSSGSATATLSSAQDFKNGCGIMVEKAGATSSLTTPSAPTVVSHLTGGSTTIKYAVVWVDNNEGYSATSATTSFATSDTYANLTLHHYNYITVASAPTAAVMGCVYSDKGAGGSLVGIGCTPTAPAGGNVQFGFQDWGQVLPFPAFLPANPPGAAGPQALFTTISSGGGTTTLTLAANASNAVSGTSAYHDESQFLYNAWLQAESGAGFPYVYIPPGLYYFGHIVPYAPFATQIHVKQVGDVYLDDLPLFFSQNNFQMYWDGALGAHNPQQFAVWPTAFIVSNNNIPQALVSNNNFWMANVQVSGVQGDAVYATGGGTGFRFEQFSVIGNSAQKGCAIRSDGNVISAYVEHFVFNGSAQQNDPGTICFNNLTQNVGTQGWMIRDGWVNNHFAQFDSPSNLMGNLCFQNLTMDWIQSESMWDRGILNVDTGSGTQSCAGQGITIGANIVQDSNRLGSTGYFTVWCLNLVQNTCVSNSILNNQQSAGTVGYSNPVEAALSTNFNLTQVNTGYHKTTGLGFDVGANGASMPRGGNVSIGTTGIIASNTGGACDSYASNCVQSAQILPPPQYNGNLSAASGGSMAAGQYCYEVSSLDASGGESVVGLEKCITVTLNQQVTIPLNDLMGFGATCYRVYRTAVNGGSGNENEYLNIQGACAGSSANAAPSFTTSVLDTGSLTYTSSTPKTSYSNAFMSALNFGTPMWLAAGINGNPSIPLGIGTTCKDIGVNSCLTDGVKVDIKGGSLRVNGGIVDGSGSGAPGGSCVNGTVYTDTATGNLYSCRSSVWVSQNSPTLDCSTMAGADDSLKLQTCISALNAISTHTGIADGRKLTGLSWSVNPFAASPIPAAGKLLLPPGDTTVQYVPVVAANNWSIEGISPGLQVVGQTGSKLVAGSAFPTTYTTGTVTMGTPGANEVITGSGTSWVNNSAGAGNIAIGCAFVSPAGGATNDTYGIISAITDSTHITLASGTNFGTGAPAGSSYDIYCPVYVMGNGAPSGAEFGMAAINIGFDANNKAGVVPLMDWFGQQRTYADNVSVRNYCGIGLDIETSAAQNSGPWTRIISTPSGSCATANTIPIALRSAFAQNFGLSGLSVGGTSTIGIDIQGSSWLISGVDTEGPTNGVSVGANSTCVPACPQTARYSAGNEIDNAYGNGTTLVHLSNAFGDNAGTGLRNLNAIGFTNMLVDDFNGCTSPAGTEYRLPLYAIDWNAKIRVSTSSVPACQPSAVLSGGLPCTNGELVLSAGWGSTATVTAVAGTGQTCQWTLTSSGTGQAANPTITDTLTKSLPTATTVCDMRMVGGTGTAALINQTTLSATAPIFTFGGTPVAASTYFVVRRCGP